MPTNLFYNKSNDISEPLNVVSIPHGRHEPPKLWDPLGAWPTAGRWLWCGAALLISFVMTPAYLVSLRPPEGLVIDFFQEWASARNYFEGLPVYTDQRATIPLYLGKTDLSPHDRTIDVNAHPPAAILLALPLANLAYRNAALVWNLSSLGMLVASLVLVGKSLRIPFSFWSVFPLATLLLLCTPLLMQQHLGQLNLAILLLLTGVWAADRSGRPVVAGVCLGLATAIKLFPGFLFLYFMLRGRWKTVIAGAVSLLALIGFTVALFGPEAYRYYFLVVLPRVAKFRGLWANASLVGFWVKLFDPPPEYPRVVPICQSPAAARLGVLVSCSAILAVLAWIVRRSKSLPEQDLAFGLAVTAMLLVSPITWEHYLLLLLVPIALAWVRLPHSDAARILFVAILVAFWSWPLQIDNLIIPGGVSTGLARPIHTLTILSYQCYALLALFALGVVEFLRCDRALSQNLETRMGPTIETKQ
jgi:Glycosyltransferase family 87